MSSRKRCRVGIRDRERGRDIVKDRVRYRINTDCDRNSERHKNKEILLGIRTRKVADRYCGSVIHKRKRKRQ